MNEPSNLRKSELRLAQSKLCCLCIVGTRPEAIKMGPVIAELGRSNWAFPYVATTGQHADVVEGALRSFGVIPSRRLNLERRNNSLNELFGMVIGAMDRVIDEVKPDCIIGDTTSVAVVSLAAFHKNVPFMHIEAGLRTGKLNDPYPEELNRRIAGLTAAMHFTPTRASLDNPLREGVPPASVLNAISRLHDHPELYARMSVLVFPYGDGQAAKRIVDAMRARLERDVATLSAA